MKKSQIFRRILVGSIVGLLALAGAYFLTPNKKIKVSYNLPNQSGETLRTTHFQKFIDTFSHDTGLTELSDEEMEELIENDDVRHYYGLQASFDDFSLEFKKDNESTLNTIKLDGGVDFMMKGLHDINFNLDIDVDYNNRYLPLEIGYVNETVYFGLKDLRLKVGSTTIDELKGDKEQGVQGLLYQLFIASEEDGGLDLDLGKIIDETYSSLIDNLLGNVDLSDLTSSLHFSALADDETGLGLDVQEIETNDGYDFDMHIDFNKENLETHEIECTDLQVLISVNKEYQLRRVDFGTLSFGNFTIKGALDIDYVKDLVVKAPVDPTYARFNPEYNYVEMINYRGWLQKLTNFLGESNQKLGISFDVDLKAKEDNALTEIGRINGSINADFSEIIDLSAYKNTNPSPKVESEETLADKIVNKATFGLLVNMIGQNDEACGNLSVKYVNNAGYVKLNEFPDENDQLKSVLKVKVDTETVNWMINEMPDMVSSVGDIDTSFLTDLFSFIGDSRLVKGIKEGDYSVILDLIKTLRNDETTITLGLDLSAVGLGEEAELNLVLDSSTYENHKVLNLDLNNVEMGSVVINATIKSDGYTNVALDEESSYDSLSFLPTVTEQVCGILGDKQVAFSLNGSLFDDKNVGISLNGYSQFDYGERYGYGQLTIDQYKYENKGLWYSHKVAIDVDDRNDNNLNNNVYFVYGDLNTSKNIKGKMNTQSILDVVDVVKTFIDDNMEDEKWNKFIEPILRMLSMSELADIINNKNYMRLLKNDLVKNVSYRNDVLNLTIGGTLFGLDGDIVIDAAFENDELKSISLVDLGLSKNRTLNLTITLEDYDVNKVSPVNKNASYMDFSSIAVLLKFGINTTENNYYHLSGTVGLSALAIINLDFDLDMYVVIKNAHTKIYGVIPDTKLSSIAQDYTPLYTTSIKSEFTFETYPDGDPNKEDGVGGYFHIKTTKETWFSTDIKHFKSTSKNFIQSDNIMVYLLNDLLLVRESISEQLGNLSLESEEYKEPGDFTNLFTDTGFKYTESQKRWDVGINLNEITGIDALRELELSVYGTSDEMLSKIGVKANIKASLVTIKITGTFNLETPNPSITDWSNSIQSAFNTINNVNFPENKLNNPNAYIEQ